MSRIASPAPPAVNSRCSVNAIAGNPMETACSQLRTMDASADVSYDHSVCTWLSLGRVFVKVTIPYACDCPQAAQHRLFHAGRIPGRAGYQCASRSLAEVMT